MIPSSNEILNKVNHFIYMLTLYNISETLVTIRLIYQCEQLCYRLLLNRKCHWCTISLFRCLGFLEVCFWSTLFSTQSTIVQLVAPCWSRSKIHLGFHELCINRILDELLFKSRLVYKDVVREDTRRGRTVTHIAHNYSFVITPCWQAVAVQGFHNPRWTCQTSTLPSSYTCQVWAESYVACRQRWRPQSSDNRKPPGQVRHRHIPGAMPASNFNTRST